MPRSGSWLLAEALERTGCCGRPREYFRADYQPRYAVAWGLKSDVPIERYVDAAVAATSTPNGVFAVKLHWGQLVHLADQLRDGTGGEVGEVLERYFPGARYVLLTRADKLRQAISLYRAVRSDTWWKLAGEDPKVGGDPTASCSLPTAAELEEVGRLERILGEHEASWRTLFASGRIGPPLEITYAALAAQYPATVRRALAFLEVQAPSTIPPPRLQRQGDAITDAWVNACQEYRREAPRA